MAGARGTALATRRSFVLGLDFRPGGAISQRGWNLAAARSCRRKAKLKPDQLAFARQLCDTRQHTVEQIGALFGVTRTTVYRSLERERAVGA